MTTTELPERPQKRGTVSRCNWGCSARRHLMTGTVHQVLTCYADDSGSSSLSRSLIPPSTLAHRVARRTAKQQRETARIPAVLLAESGKAPEHRAILPIWATPFIDSWRRCVSGGSPLKPLSLPLTGTPGPSHTLPFQPLIFPNPLLPRGRQAPGRPHPCPAVSTHDSCWRPLHARGRSLAWPTRRRLKCYGQPQGSPNGLSWPRRESEQALFIRLFR